MLFFLVGVVKTCGSFAEVKKPEMAVKLFIRFAIAKGVVTYGLELMMAFFDIVQGMISRQVENLMLGVKTNAANWQRRQNANNNFSAMLPYDLELQRKETKEFLEDLTTRDQRMMFAVLTLVHMADTKKQLDDDTEAIMTAARKKLCQLSILKWQQMDGLNTALPVGVRKIKVMRTLTTESLL